MKFKWTPLPPSGQPIIPGIVPDGQHLESKLIYSAEQEMIERSHQKYVTELSNKHGVSRAMVEGLLHDHLYLHYGRDIEEAIVNCFGKQERGR